MDDLKSSENFSSLATTTEKGKSQSENVGKFIKNRYLGFDDMPTTYNGTKFTFYSSYLPRAKTTAISFANGLFPNNGPTFKDEPVFIDSMQPVPIRSSLPDNEYLLLPTLNWFEFF